MSGWDDLNAVMQQALQEQAGKSGGATVVDDRRRAPASDSVTLLNELEVRLPPIRRGYQHQASSLEAAFADTGTAALWAWRFVREVSLFLLIAWCAVLVLAFADPDNTNPVALVAVVTVALRLAGFATGQVLRAGAR